MGIRRLRRTVKRKPRLFFGSERDISTSFMVCHAADGGFVKHSVRYRGSERRSSSVRIILRPAHRKRILQLCLLRRRSSKCPIKGWRRDTPGPVSLVGIPYQSHLFSAGYWAKPLTKWRVHRNTFSPPHRYIFSKNRG